MTQVLRIGGASGFWGEAPHATAQLLGAGVDVLVYDYLAEITMSIMARARMKDASLGYATDFVTDAMAPNLQKIAAGGIKVLSNAGGVNPSACAEALRARIADAGLSLKVAVVEGDDLLPRADEFAGAVEMFSGAPMPPRDRIASMNAYLGAAPVVAALAAGADIVITGRCADSALTLAACMHRFGWTAGDHDLLAAGSLAGHLLECGPQSTGGNFTDWQQAGDLARIGYPIAEISADGGMVLTKPEGSTGIVSPASVGEQMVYEIGDPQAYLLPDVICDFSEVELSQDGPDRVRVSGAKGRAPTGRLKVSATWADGYRAGMVFQMNGRNARDKARAFAQMGLDRARARLAQLGAPDYREVSFEAFGGRPGPGEYEEIAYKAAVRHDDARAVGLFLKELIGGALATPPGLHFFTGGGRPKPSPVVALFSFLVDADAVTCRVTLDGQPVAFGPVRLPIRDIEPSVPKSPPAAEPAAETVARPLEELAWARSGDKGDSANIGVIARHPAYMPYIWEALTPEAVARVFADELRGEVARFYLPGIDGMNILMTQVLGGGGVASLRNDPQGKAFAQKLLSLPVHVPAGLIVNS
ncbi:terpene utilization protein AtuA [Ruegeria marisrubri]|uniref:Terpene utilization protein AtuA n=1 Tax=Ruegeria marisrubri TaxID=1685379 RepID=A0A0X3TKF1_9RHOB|nr:acyclic terpene utilization AtuA family protein [Ruegeria marisrubri]KUJ76257.1 terpene utilization protein AtuA [Ruegeria marisrubri]